MGCESDCGVEFREFLAKRGLKEGDFVELEKDDRVYTGTLLPSAEASKTCCLTLKLANGYNIGVRMDDKIRLKKLEAQKTLRGVKPPERKVDPNRPTLALVHTGGTIASKVDYVTGGVKAGYRAEDLLAMYPELDEIARFECSAPVSMMSEDARFTHYEKMAAEIERLHAKENVHGIIVAHGTDTLGYSGAALSFALEGLNKPVLLVGAQRSPDRGSTDAAMNLVCATAFAAETDFAGVGICMHAATDDEWCSILPGTKTRKLHTTRRDAFKAVNDSPIARIHYSSKKIEYFKSDYPRRDAKKKLVVRKGFEQKTALVKMHPNLFPEVFDFYREKGYKGVVLEGTGMGHAPTNIAENLPNYEALKRLVASGCLVVMTSQCLWGRVNLRTYTNLRRLGEIGVLSGKDMLPETAFVKLAWLLGNFSAGEARKLVGENLRGEITAKTGIDGFGADAFDR